MECAFIISTGSAFESVSLLTARNVLTPLASAVSATQLASGESLGFEMAATEPVKWSIKYFVR